MLDVGAEANAAPDTRPPAPPPRPRSRWSTVAKVLILVLVYAALAAAGDTRAASGSDAGGKVATVRTMAENGALDPDVGYWAEQADPDGDLHPLTKTDRIGDRWVQVTTLPMAFLAVPLWQIGGPAALLALPMAGAVAAALGARAIARRLGARTGWPAFWMVGAASPIGFYALDFWEHAPAVGLALVAIALVMGDQLRPGRAVLAGLSGGLAAALRPEIAIYLVVLALASVLVADRRSVLRRQVPGAVVVAVVAGATLGANQVLERIVLGGGVQTARVGSQVDRAGGDLVDRARDAVVTTFGVLASAQPTALAIGALLVAGLVAVASGVRNGDRRGTALGGALVGIGYAMRAATGLGFVPGTLPAAPMGVVALHRQRDGRARVLLIAATASLPLVWLFQWTGSLVPQWGGRYTLLTGALLVVLATVELEQRGWRSAGARAFVGLSVAVAAFGLLWHIQRTNEISATIEAIESAPADVVIVSTLDHLGREAGAWYGDHRWLTAATPTDLELAATVLVDLDVDRFDLVVAEAGDGPFNPPPGMGGYELVGRRPVGVGFASGWAVLTYQAQP
ncbi:MAG: hypothetical protein WKF93_10765 [Acidimicrobiales bacterium]